jgi:hypothetical protein
MSGLGKGMSKKRTALSGKITILFFSRYLTATVKQFTKLCCAWYNLLSCQKRQEENAQTATVVFAY